MPQSYSETKAWTSSQWFRDRVEVALSTYTNYLLNAADPVEDWEEKNAAGKYLGQNSTMVMQTLMFSLPGDTGFQDLGPAITDEQLKTYVEKIIKQYYPQQPVTPLGAPIMHSPFLPPPMPPTPTN